MTNDSIPKLDQEQPLTEQDIRCLIRHMDEITGSHNRGLGQVVVRSALEQIRAVRKFDESSTRLATRIYWLTLVVVALTLVMTVFTVLLWVKS